MHGGGTRTSVPPGLALGAPPHAIPSAPPPAPPQVAIKKVLQDKRFKNRELQITRMLNHCNVINLKHCFYSHDAKVRFQKANTQLGFSYFALMLFLSYSLVPIWFLCEHVTLDSFAHFVFVPPVSPHLAILPHSPR